MSPAQAPEGGISIIPLGAKPSLTAQGKITDPSTGFSTSLNFLDPALQLASALHASGVPIGKPSPDSPFAGTGVFIPHVLARNLTGSPQSVTVTLEYPGEKEPQQTSLAPLALGPYATEDVALDFSFGLLPLPLPYCSIRIQYSGPPGSVIGEVSSVESNGDLVIDSRLANKGDGWAGSGGHPWHLDSETESVLFLTNMSDRDARIGFQVQGGGVHYYLTDLSLKPHETKPIDLRKLRDAQKPDFRGTLIPANASDGSVLWVRVDDVPVMGRLVVLQRHKGVASSYRCTLCPCGLNLRPTPLVMTPSSANVTVGGTQQFGARATYFDCNSNYYPYDVTSGSSWSSSDTSIATVSGGKATGKKGGIATIKATFSGCIYVYPCPAGSCICVCSPTLPSGSATLNVVAITGLQTVWWFYGQTPSGYATTITLTAQPSGASSYSWSLLAGTDKATLGGQSGNTINLTGNDLSTSSGDVTVQVSVTTPAGTKLATRTITVRGPYKLVPGSKFHSALTGYGYESQIWYTIYDNFNVTMPSAVPFTEEWTTNPVPRYTGTDCNGLVPPGTNWGLPQFIPTPHGDTASNSQFYDRITGPGINNTPAPCPTPTGPQTPLGPLVVQWGQRWRVGTITSGFGASVQADTFERFVDHGDHTAITSPD